MSHFVDIHTHAHFSAYKDDWRAVIERALAQDVWLVNVGTQCDTSQKAVEIAHLFPAGVFAAVGLHPVHTSQSFHDIQELGDEAMARGFTSRGEICDPEYYLQLAGDPKVVAIGECGLDYYYGSRLPAGKAGNTDHGTFLEEQRKQKEAFVTQIELAQKAAKPLMLHCREAFADMIAILRDHREKLLSAAGAAHFFTGSAEDAAALLDLGFAFTFGGVVTFARSYDEIIRRLPLDSILSETDAPYVTPEPYRGQRNEPAYVVEVVRKLAELRGLSEERMKEQIFANAQRVFRL